MRNLVWWIVYIVVAVWLQKFIPGLDALVPGLIVCLQEKNRQQTFLFLLFCVVLQEGTGTLPFGASIIWYGFVFTCFYAGGWFFMAGNQGFVFLLSVALAAGRGLLFIGMSELQQLPLDTQVVVPQCLAQVFFTPIIWLLSGASRRKYKLQVS
ncbi:hypothetical protein LJC48_02005 [Desulfovibrio sp. OttesenSCG-928-C06]|nr:hypothetical protein [Desulfovibrio sp. OttesenSCG-928-C06]